MTDDELVAEHLLLLQDRARQDPAEFFELVMEEENTRAPIKVAPHQRVLLDFIMAHPLCVILLPINHAKTYSQAGLALWLLGRDPSMRGSIVSATQRQAEKPLAMARDYIDSSRALKWVWPELSRSKNIHDPWSQTSIVIDRPYGIRDPSLYAVGFEGAIAGSRLSWVLVDDLVNEENSRTQDGRSKVESWFWASVRSRLDPSGGRIAVTNTANHPEDLPHRLKRSGWPALTMRIDGTIILENTSWDSPHIRPSTPASYECRLIAHDPDPSNEETLWPERFPRTSVEQLRREFLPHKFNQLYMNLCRDDGTARCKIEWVDECKRLATLEGITGMVSEYTGPNLTLTGVDLAIRPGEGHDDTAFFTFEARPDGVRVILDVEIGQWDGPTIVDKLFDKHKRYNSIVRVETVAAQDFIRQFALDRDRSIPVKPHVTSAQGKAHPQFGVEGLFLEFSNSAWRIPCDKRGVVHPQVQRFIDACLYYTPQHHTDDVLMAAFFAREQARDWGALTRTDGGGGRPTAGDNAAIGMNIMSR